MQKVNTTASDTWSAFQLGEESAFHTIYSTYYNDLFNYCYGILKNRTTTEDCLQDFFVPHNFNYCLWPHHLGLRSLMTHTKAASSHRKGFGVW